MSTRVLSFFGDQKLWENAPKLLLWPSGINYDRPFRYRSKWVPPRLQTAVAGWSGKVLVCMKDSTNPSLYVPLRFANLRKVETKGEYTFFYFSPEEFIKYADTYQVDHYAATISANIPGDERGYLVAETELTAPIDKSPSGEDSRSWDVLTKLLITGKGPAFERLYSSVFLGSLEVEDASGVAVERNEDASGFRLKTDSEYHMKILVVIPNATERGLNLDAFQLRIEGPFTPNTSRASQVTSSYDELDLSFRSTSIKTSGAIAIMPGSVEVLGGEAPPMRIPAAEIPVRVAPSYSQVATRTVIPILFISVGLVLEGSASLVAENLRYIPITIGTVLAAAGLYFRK